MKIEIEIPDLEEIYLPEGSTEQDLKNELVNAAIKVFVDDIYNDYFDNYKIYNSIYDNARELVKNNSKEIIDKVVDIVSKDVIKRKAIKDELPKKSELTNISKEWEQYFIELIDRAIAKRFK